MSVFPGFAAAPRDAQRAFRAILMAMARPGLVVDMNLAHAPDGLSPAAAAALLALCDGDTPIWLDAAALVAAPFLHFHCGSPIAAQPMTARFAYCSDPGLLPSLESFALGTDDYPDRSTTLLLEVALGGTPTARLTGPGIEREVRLGLRGLSSVFWEERADLMPLFPRGLDLILTSGNKVAALPRSVRVEI
jgi:alpha-D-ribose 1-methylphosphonate 5-triphosphate synthase subunit PhnH